MRRIISVTVDKNGNPRRVDIEPEVFVTAWQMATSPADAARRLGIRPINASQRASYMRKLGVKLKKFPTPILRTRKPDIGALNAIVTRLGG